MIICGRSSDWCWHNTVKQYIWQVVVMGRFHRCVLMFCCCGGSGGGGVCDGCVVVVNVWRTTSLLLWPGWFPGSDTPS